jgi:AcrR family transcriptional regulator
VAATKTALTKDAVVDRALSLGDAEGLDAVTIRRLAQELGVTPMALYWHFKNKELLLIGMVDRLMAGVAIDVDPGGRWQVRLRAQAEALLKVMRAHPSMPGLLEVTDKQRSENFALATETALKLLVLGGFTLNHAYAIASYILGGVRSLVATEPGCPYGVPREMAAEWQRASRLQMASYPADRFPHLTEFGASLDTERDLVDYYAFGIDLLMAGIESMAVRG